MRRILISILLMSIVSLPIGALAQPEPKGPEPEEVLKTVLDL